jgi:streptogramin lyase
MGSEVGELRISFFLFVITVSFAPGSSAAAPAGSVLHFQTRSFTGTIIPQPPKTHETQSAHVGRASITEYQLPFNAEPGKMAVGPDGNIWMTIRRNAWPFAGIGRITPTGVADIYAIRPQDNDFQVAALTPGPNNRIWFAVESQFKHTYYVQSMSTSGDLFGQYDLTAATGPDWLPYAIVGTGANELTFSEVLLGNSPQWQLELLNSDSGYIALAGGPWRNETSITKAANGNLWWAEGSNIGTSGPSGSYTRLLTPDQSSPLDIASAPDGSVWFGEDKGRVGVLSSDGNTVNMYTVPTATAQIQQITVAADGIVWFAEYLNPMQNAIGRLDPSDASIVEYGIPTPVASIPGIVAGPDGRIWFTEGSAGKVGALAP